MSIGCKRDARVKFWASNDEKNELKKTFCASSSFIDSGQPAQNSKKNLMCLFEN